MRKTAGLTGHLGDTHGFPTVRTVVRRRRHCPRLCPECINIVDIFFHISQYNLLFNAFQVNSIYSQAIRGLIFFSAMGGSAT
jgi:hypothetical protein